jgi:hypothetical protein
MGRVPARISREKESKDMSEGTYLDEKTMGAPTSRRKFLAGSAAALAGGALMAVPGVALAKDDDGENKHGRVTDVEILNYALTLEYLEAAFYAAAIKNKAFSSDAYKTFATITGDHEAAHVAALKKLLGSKAVKSPTFDFGPAVTDPATFAATAQVLEDTGVSAYAGQGPNIKTRAIVVAALSIHSVEARHAAWIRFLNTGGAGAAGKLPAPAGFDKAASERTVLAAVTKTGFIKG